MTVRLAATAIDILRRQFAGGVKLRRRVGGQYVEGRWIDGTVDNDVPVQGVIYHMPGEDIQRLPEELRREDMRYFWTRTPLRVQTRTEQPDQVVYNGDVFDVVKVWERFEGSYHKVALGRDHVRTNTI